MCRAASERMHTVKTRPAGVLMAAVLTLLPVCAIGQVVGPSPASADRLSIGETFTLESEVLGETRRINVYLPPPYAATPDVRLPVLYMPDGGLAEDFLHVAGLVQISVANGTMRPFILVGIENTHRRRDLTGPTTDPADRKIAPVVGGAAAFRRFIRSELMPVIASRYRTAAERAVVGESLAGLFVVETLFREPDLFDTYIAIDPSLWWNRAELVKTASRGLATLGTRQTTLYLSSSSEKELARLTTALAGVLRGRAPATLRWYHVPLPGETHRTIFHPAALRAFRQVFAPEAEGIGVAASEQGGPCVALPGPPLAAGSPVTLLDPVAPQRIHRSVIRAAVKACALLGSRDIPGPYYLLVPAAVPDQLPRVAIAVAGRAAVRSGPDGIRLRLSDRVPDARIRACASSEGMHLTVWSGTPLRSTRLYHAYWYLGYDVEPDCQPRDHQQDARARHEDDLLHRNESRRLHRRSEPFARLAVPVRGASPHLP